MASEPRPLTSEDLDEMRERLRTYINDRSPKKPSTFLRATDMQVLLDEVSRLRELKCSVCGMRVAHLNHAGHVIGWGCADGEQCEPASGMPRPPAEEARERSGAGIGSTGVPGPEKPAQAFSRWRVGGPYGRAVYAMAGGAPSRSDRLVTVMYSPEIAMAAAVAHNKRMALGEEILAGGLCAKASEVPDVDGWSLHSRLGGMLLSHDTDADMPTLWSDGPMQLGAVLAFIADQEDPDA